jgi:hypothetical protein
LVDFESKRMTINITMPYNEKLLRKIDAAYFEHMKDKATEQGLRLYQTCSKASLSLCLGFVWSMLQIA